MYGTINLALIIVIGVMTSYTDIVYKKIWNAHLLWFFLVAVLCHGIFWSSISWSEHGINVLIAVVIALFLYLKNMWRAGDAKLFILYSLVLVSTRYDAVLLSPSITLFVGAFITGFFALLPLLFWTIIHDKGFFSRKNMVHYLERQKISLLLGFMPLSWLLLPLIDAIPVIRNAPLIKGLIMVVVFSGLRELFKTKRVSVLVKLLVTLLGGFIIRAWIMPELLSFPSLLSQLLKIFSYSCLFYLFLASEAWAKDGKDRIPFAPFLFIGSLLSYTDVYLVIFRFFGVKDLVLN